MYRKTLYKTVLCGFIILCSCQSLINEKQESKVIWKNKEYTVYPDSVVQGSFTARIISENEIVSNYKSPANESRSPEIIFKFSINGKDNELTSGQNHEFICLAENGTCETPVIQFGERFVDDRSVPKDTFLKPNTPMLFRLDMRQVFNDFDKKGFYEAFNGERIYKEDFKSVFVAGDTPPLIWDFDNLYTKPQLELKDPDGDHIYEASIIMNVYEKDKVTASQWTLSNDISELPHYESDYPLLNAMYNMSLDEMLKNVEDDGTFRTGKEWAGVWTRDISYSLILSMANLKPDVAKKSLMRKVKNNRIIQDTGTGGAYPVSTDRIVWTLAAWEIFTATGDREWFETAYKIILNSLEDDLKNAFNEEKKMFRGESSFLDWREQSYPEWMQPADIFDSYNLGTNAVFYKACIILSEMADLKNEHDVSGKYKHLATQVKKGINAHLWMEDKGYYGQYLYGRNYKILSPKSEALGEALTVLFDVADNQRQEKIIASTPVMDFGIPTIYPQIPNIPPYHNNGIWPFVQAYWSLAAAKTGNERALMESMAAIYRQAALFLTNKENFVAHTGDYAGTQINSDRQLWSVAGNLAMTYKIILGLEYQPDRLLFNPFIPEPLKGTHEVSNFRYRNSILKITVEGYGNKIESFTLDGQEQDEYEISSDISGEHEIRIKLTNDASGGKGVNQVAHHVTPVSPDVKVNSNKLEWEKQNGVKEYVIIKNGKRITSTKEDYLAVDPGEYAEFQVIAVDNEGYESFASEPLRVGVAQNEYIIEIEKFADKSDLSFRGYSGSGFVEATKEKNKNIKIAVELPEDGLYALDFRYSNGSGPINTDNKVAVRTLSNDGNFVGTVVFPQRGTDEWSDWGFTNSIHVKLRKGTNNLTLSFEQANENMNGEINRAMVDFMRLVKLPEGKK